MPTFTFTFLGTGTSTGIPMLGCTCPVCISDDSHDQRWRCSALVTDGATRVVIDTPPEFRLQCLRADVSTLDAVLLTHDHADHIAGLDDVRSYNFAQRCVMPIHCDARTAQSIRTRFAYIWKTGHVGGGLPKIEIHQVDGPVQVGPFTFEPLVVDHGPSSILAWRVGSLGYVTDVSHIPEAAWERLRGLDVLILDAVRFEPHPTHFSVEQACAVMEQLKPRQGYLTHINHNVCHARDSAKLPDKVALAYDGLVVPFEI